jgi:hypothetical protein
LRGRISLADAVPGTAFTLEYDEVANIEAPALSAA